MKGGAIRITGQLESYILILAVVMLFIPLLKPPPYILHVLIITFLFAYLCTSWSIVSGYARQVSLGHSAFFGVGVYTTGLLLHYFDLTPWIGGLIAVLAATFLAILIGLPCFKLGVRGPYFLFATLALAKVLEALCISQRRITGGELGIALPYKGTPLYFQFSSKVPYYYVAIAMWLLVLFLSRKIQRSKMGYYLFAVRMDEDAAEACGINVFKMKMISLLLSAGLTAWGGVFYCCYYLYIQPSSVFGLPMSFQIATTSLVGGATSWVGPSLGAFLVIPTLESARSILGGEMIGVPLLFYGILLILVGRFIPEGLSMLLFKGKTRVR